MNISVKKNNKKRKQNKKTEHKNEMQNWTTDVEVKSTNKQK